jgi:hypothetical protein
VGLFASGTNGSPVSTSFTITTGSVILIPFTVVFDILVITHPFATFTRIPARHTPGNSSFPSAIVNPISAGKLTIVSDRGGVYSYSTHSFP